MTQLAENLRAFLATAKQSALVDVASTRGSTPREKGAWMLVSSDRIFGTIGGGQLEYMAIEKARSMLGAAAAARLSAPHPYPLPVKDGERGTSTVVRNDDVPLSPSLRGEGKGEGQTVRLSVPLGPEIGQCCGGRVELSIRLVGSTLRDRLMREAETEDAAAPHVYIFGGGHVGHALANALRLLPVRAVIVETRQAELAGLPEGVEARLTPMPEDIVRDAPAGSAFLILTHDHALDFLIVAEALKRDDAAYVGMIGSKTKKATFRSWYLKNAGGNQAAFNRLVSPIGNEHVKDKRPAVIAALAAAEVMTALAYQLAATADVVSQSG